ncbi:MAG: hypothetical protein BGO55_12835 [Sphingobacteriales bacterium 50-39]|nr:hypothetical protein [Sphingobacteriales bacterium]OJW57194.1 MAG: hypothetical protein BGO55_12835 [Sphingobacteriales bacterium 50-39]
MKQFREGEEFYYNEEGLMVLTEKYHLERGYCCGNGCRHCPFNYVNVPEPRRSKLIAQQAFPDNNSTESSSLG